MVDLKNRRIHHRRPHIAEPYSSARLQNCPFKPPAGTGSESPQSRPRVAA